MKHYYSALYGVILLCSAMSVALANSDSLNVNITGTINDGSCSVNANSTITVEFGNVNVSQLSAAKAKVPITISCDNAPSGTVSLLIKGTPTSFDSQALATDMGGLGIELINISSTQYGTLNINTPYDVSSTFGLASKTGTFNLDAILTSDGTSVLAGGEFNATATLVLQMS
ncbi:fimbrial protein [Enterobacter bugandensis]|uniref:fimbrial protein n=1 Tax=Enterobacter bugandensis TaxID=881260 RepID=UPI0022E980BD|nr:fimbrial protein [Enterobacter bugandensis]